MEIDVARVIDAVEREVRASEHEGRPARVVVARRTYDTTVEDLWDALTNPERIPRWFLPVSGELRLGGRYQLQGNAGGRITGCEPPRSFAATWEFGEAVSWIAVRLTEAASGGATLELQHTALAEGDLWDQYGPGAVGVGWELALAGLGQHLATGETIDPAAGAAWATTDDGRRFVTSSSAGWGGASIAYGTEAAAARAAAARTTAFYTGAPPS